MSTLEERYQAARKEAEAKQAAHVAAIERLNAAEIALEKAKDDLAREQEAFNKAVAANRDAQREERRLAAIAEERRLLLLRDGAMAKVKGVLTAEEMAAIGVR